ncbi:MAG TPA: FkbM family methyltransferase [Actinokineospora sp.]|nr:FkbM family methyltransferase [Actinokineospora sp.]
MSEQALPAAGTIVARNYLPAARVLARSYLRHHPGGRFAVLVVDAEDGELEALSAASPEVEIVGPADLDVAADEYARMAFAYSVTELSTAVKPWLLRRLLKDSPTAIYLDPDIEVFARFADEVGELALAHEIVLTPHVLKPMPRDGKRPSEADIMASGVFNLGFIGVSAAAEPFLEFWAERLRQDAISSVTEQLFTDQRWVDNVPALFSNTVISDPGFNVAYWNVYQRPLERGEDGAVTAAGAPLRFVHYSGFRPEKPWLLSTHFADRPRVLLSEQPLLGELCASYRDQLIELGYSRALDEVPYRWNKLPDGTKVSPSLRRAFRQDWVDADRDGEPAPPSPFHSDPARFLRWATEPADAQQRRAGLNRWLLSIWQYRPDLQKAFPDPLNADAADFRAWCGHSGISEAEIPPHVIAERPAAEPVAVIDTLGVNVLGYLTAELGVGEMGRLAHDAVVASGIPVATVVEDSTVSNRTGHALPAHARVGDPAYPVSVLCVNADMTAKTLGLHPDLAGDRHVVGLWSWELEEFPQAMHDAFGLVDEVWTISEFCAAAIEKFSPVPVRVFPVPVRDPLDGVPAVRARGDQATILFAFDHNSVFERKNPLAAIAAFTTAFPGRDDVRLVIKSINGEKHPVDRERLRAEVAGDPRITLIERYLSADEVRELFASADCYLSLHRSEGFGLTVAEAMAHGLPVVSTDYSGTAEFLTAATGWPIPARLVPVGKGNGPYPPGAVWAEPDVSAAAAALRQVVDEPATAAARGQAAREHILGSRSMDAAARWVRERIEAAYQGRTTRSRPDEVPAPVLAVREAREALKWRADPGTASRLPMAGAVRRAVLRLIDHYDHHQRTVVSALLDGVESGVDQLARQQRAAEERLARLDGHLARIDRDRRGIDRDRVRLENLIAAGTDRVADLERELDQERAASAEQAAAFAQRVDELDAKFIGLLGERDRRLNHVERAAAEAAVTLPALREGLARHHDLLDPAPAHAGAGVATDVGMLRLPATDTVVRPWLATYGTWEQAESRLIDLLLPRGGVFVDIGAHVGYFTVRALRLVGADGTVVAVEPWEPVRDLLAHNVRSNVPAAVASALTVVPAAAWDRDEDLRLGLSAEGNSGDNRISPDGEVPVPAIRLDGLDALAGKRIDVVKSDAQGHDHRALAGMAGLFAEHRPHVVCEFDPGAISEGGADPRAVLHGYREAGFEPIIVSPELVRDAEQAGDLRVLCSSRAASDDELLAAAQADPAGFITLWLYPGAS